MSAMIEVSNVVKSFGALEVLKGVSFEVAQGEAAVIIGASGSGKSTILRCINFLEDFQGGTIRVDGQSVGYDTRPDGGRVAQSEATIARHRQEVGMVFQSFNLFPHKTVVENVMTGPVRAKGMARKEARDIAEALLAKVGLSAKLDELPANLSGGQQQRVAIARALIHEPRLLVCDEPTSALDAELGRRVMSLIRDRSHQHDRAVIVVTHDDRIFHLADRIAQMDDGLIKNIEIRAGSKPL